MNSNQAQPQAFAPAPSQFQIQGQGQLPITTIQNPQVQPLATPTTLSPTVITPVTGRPVQMQYVVQINGNNTGSNQSSSSLNPGVAAKVESNNVNLSGLGQIRSAQVLNSDPTSASRIAANLNIGQLHPQQHDPNAYAPPIFPPPESHPNPAHPTQSAPIPSNSGASSIQQLHLNPNPHQQPNMQIRPQLPTEFQQASFLRFYEQAVGQALDQRLGTIHHAFKAVCNLNNTTHSNQAVLNSDHRSLASQMAHYIQVQAQEHAALKTLIITDRERERERQSLSDREREREREREKEDQRARQKELDQEREHASQREKRQDQEIKEILKVLNQLNQRFQGMETAVESYGRRVDLLALGMGQIDKKFGPLTAALQESEFTLKEIYESIKDPAAFSARTPTKATPSPIKNGGANNLTLASPKTPSIVISHPAVSPLPIQPIQVQSSTSRFAAPLSRVTSNDADLNVSNLSDNPFLNGTQGFGRNPAEKGTLSPISFTQMVQRFSNQHGDLGDSVPVTPTPIHFQSHGNSNSSGMSFLTAPAMSFVMNNSGASNGGPSIQPVTPTIMDSLSAMSNPSFSNQDNPFARIEDMASAVSRGSMNVTPTRPQKGLKRTRSDASLDDSARSSKSAKTVRFMFESQQPPGSLSVPERERIEASPSLSNLLDSELSSLTESDDELGGTYEDEDVDMDGNNSPSKALPAKVVTRKSSRLSGSGLALVFTNPNRSSKSTAPQGILKPPSYPYLPRSSRTSSKPPPPKKVGKVGMKKKRRVLHGPRPWMKKSKTDQRNDADDINQCTDLVVWDPQQQQPPSDPVQMIGCDTCARWYHSPCVGISNEELEKLDEDAPYTCPACQPNCPAEFKISEVRNSAACAYANCTIKDTGIYFIDYLLGRKPDPAGAPNEFRWLVKWHNYEIQDCTWKQESTFEGASLIQNFYLAAHKEGLDLTSEMNGGDQTVLLEEARTFNGTWVDDLL